MKIKNTNSQDIISNANINSKFLNVDNTRLGNCTFLNSNFYLDSFNFFPITDENYVFEELFKWGENSKYSNFYSHTFYENFLKAKKNTKKFSDTLILGSSVMDDDYRNLLTFFPRIFFINDKEINLAIHRNSSNQFRKFISETLNALNIKIKKFVFLDDEIYRFENSKIPQFFNFKKSISILNQMFIKNHNIKKKKIYLSRQNSSYRNLINESDIIEILKSKDFKIYNIDNMSFKQRINIFSSASIIVSPTSSSLVNLIFCSKGTEVLEIIPKYKFSYEQNLKNRYLDISNYLGLKYSSIQADPVDLNEKNSEIKNFISNKARRNSNYFKNLLVKKNIFLKMIEKY